jgi:hypothetical protein
MENIELTRSSSFSLDKLTTPFSISHLSFIIDLRRLEENPFRCGYKIQFGSLAS